VGIVVEFSCGKPNLQLCLTHTLFMRKPYSYQLII